MTAPRAPRTPTEIYDAVLESARRQAATTRQGQAIAAAGLGAELDALIRAIAGNLGNVLADDED
jgi:hypothetical protein